MTTTAPPTRSCDAQDLVIAHQAFRRVYSLAPDAVRSTDPADRARVASIASTLKAINAALHHHHTVEDTMLWDTLAERRPACGLHVELMKRQHGTVAALLARAPELIRAWRRHPGRVTAEPLAALFTEIGDVLEVHLAAEETRILPVIEQVISAGEWQKVGNAAKAVTAPAQGFLMLGLIYDLMPAEEREAFDAELPGPVTFVWALVGRHLYDRMMASLRHRQPASPPPPRRSGDRLPRS